MSSGIEPEADTLPAALSCDAGLRMMLMRKLRTYGRLSPAERRLAWKSIILVAVVRLALWVLPFRTVQAICRRSAQSRRGRTAEAQQIASAVQLGGRCVPRATCLVQALAAQVLLGRHGHEAQVHIGVARDAQRGLRAHAWVESQGRILVGATERLEDYIPILPMDGAIGR